MCGSAREQLWHAVHSFAFAPATGIGNRKLCEMCSICVNKPEMMCRLPADHFENEGKDQEEKKGQSQALNPGGDRNPLQTPGRNRNCIYIYAFIYLAKGSVASPCLPPPFLVCPLC